MGVLAAVLRMDLWEVVPPLLAGLALGQVVRAVVVARREHRDVGQAVRTALRDLWPVARVLSGVFVALAVLLALEGILVVVVIVAALSALGGDGDSAGGWVALLLLGMLATAIVVGVLLLRLLRRAGRAVREDRVTGRPALGLGRVGVLVVAVNVVVGYTAVVGIVPAWVDAPSSCAGGTTVEVVRPAGAPVPVRPAPELPAGRVDELASRAGVIAPIRVEGMGGALTASPTISGGFSLSVRRGTHEPLDRVRRAALEAVLASGAAVSSSGSASGSLGSSFHIDWAKGAATGVISGRSCDGLRKPSLVTSDVRIGPARVGACAAAARFGACDAIYAAADALLDDAGGPGDPVPGGAVTIGPAIAAVADVDARLVLDQPAVPVERFFSDGPFADPSISIGDELVRQGWTRSTPPRNATDAPATAGAPQVLEATRTVPGAELRLHASFDGDTTAFRIETVAAV